MAVDMFLKLDPIKGESQDDKHKDEIQVLAWSWGLSQSGTMHDGTGGGSGKVNVQDLSLTKYVDMASADLLKALTTGQHVDKGTLVVRKAGGSASLEYITVEMEKVIVTSISAGGSGGEDRLTENVTLNFADFKYTYKQQTEKGASGAAPTFGWQIAAGKEK